MSRASTLELHLRDLPSVGTLIKDRPYRQVWRFEHEGRACYLKFYPRQGGRHRVNDLRDRFRRATRGSPAMLEFTRLQSLQRASIPAPRAVAVLVGFRIGETRGDAVIIEAIEPSVQLDQYLREFELAGRPVPEHRELARQVRELVRRLVVAGLGHEDLHLGNLLLHEGGLFLLDGYSVRSGMRARDLYRLGHSAIPFATRTDFLRAWRLLADGPPPKRNPLSRTLRGEFLQRIESDNEYFGRLRSGDWSGAFFRRIKFPRRWSAASRLHITEADWERQWPLLLEAIERDDLEVLKRTRSGDVLAGEMTFGGVTLQVIVKRPRKRYWYRYLNDAFRASRSRRSWIKAWNLIVRNLPTAWPLAVMERRRFGYVTDSLIIFERVPGPTLRKVNLDAMSAERRDNLFRRTGRILRIIDETGLAHFDAKASNWIVREDETGPSPVVIDSDAVRFRNWPALGLQRLLRSMREHPKFTPADSLSLCAGYAPFARTQAADAEPSGDSSGRP